MTSFNFNNKILDLSFPAVMGIVNLTPDSFSDGGRLFSNSQVDLDAVLRCVERMIADGATILDLGGESTRPGAQPVSEQQEMDRVLPAVSAIRARFDAVISVDTSSTQLIREAAANGADLINDVRALQRDGALQAAAEAGLPVCLMHMQKRPDNMQEDPVYANVFEEVKQFLMDRVATCLAAGIAAENIILDPGFGFGKTLQHNLQLFRQLPELFALGFPVLVGVSRKTMIGQIANCAVEARLSGSVTMAVLAAQRGASILRVHDVRETVQALQVWRAVNEGTEGIEAL